MTLFLFKTKTPFLFKDKTLVMAEHLCSSWMTSPQNESDWNNQAEDFTDWFTGK